MAEILTRDYDVELRTQNALAGSSIYALRRLRVEREGDALLISGRVKSFYEKQLAQEVVRATAPGVTVVNLIEVE